VVFYQILKDLQDILYELRIDISFFDSFFIYLVHLLDFKAHLSLFNYLPKVGLKRILFQFVPKTELTPCARLETFDLKIIA
jgi:hypothetical protein